METNLTQQELERIITVLCCNIDLFIQPTIDKAMAQKRESDAMNAIQCKHRDQEIIAKLNKLHKGSKLTIS